MSFYKKTLSFLSFFLMVLPLKATLRPLARYKYMGPLGIGGQETIIINKNIIDRTLPCTFFIKDDTILDEHGYYMGKKKDMLALAKQNGEQCFSLRAWDNYIKKITVYFVEKKQIMMSPTQLHTTQICTSCSRRMGVLENHFYIKTSYPYRSCKQCVLSWLYYKDKELFRNTFYGGYVIDYYTRSKSLWLPTSIRKMIMLYIPKDFVPYPKLCLILSPKKLNVVLKHKDSSNKKNKHKEEKSITKSIVGATLCSIVSMAKDI